MLRATSPTREKDPSVITAEKLLTGIMTGDLKPLMNALDPAIHFQSPMGVFVGRPYVKPFLEFESELLRPYQHLIRQHGTVAEDSLRVGRVEWSVGGLHFSDVVTQTQLLTIRSIKRTVRRESKTAQDHEIAEQILLGWTGPYFSKFCGVRSSRNVDHRAIVFPVIDYSYMSLSHPRSLLVTAPKEGCPIADDNCVFHFLEEAMEEEKKLSNSPSSAEGIKHAAEAASKEGGKGNFGDAGQGGRRGTTITIQAKNRAGEVNAIIIEKSALDGKGTEGSRLDALEDAEQQVRRERNRYMASGLRASNNNFTTIAELPSITRIYLVNSFYFLTVVDVSSNKITSLPDLSQMLSLHTLYAHDNQIADWKEVEHLTSISQLQTLTLFGNPIQQNSDSARAYKFSVLSIFYSPTGFKVFPSRQQTLTHHASVVAAASRPSSRSAMSAAAAAPQEFSGGRSPSPSAALQPLVVRAPTPAMIASRAKRTDIDPPTTTSSSPTSLSANASHSLAVSIVKIRLKQLDHCVISPLEVETLEQFLPTIKRRIRRATSPNGAAVSATAAGGKKQHHAAGGGGAAAAALAKRAAA